MLNGRQLAWIPKTQPDLQAAAENGALREGHHLDLKASLGIGERANRDLAIDIASFAVDGGQILIGLDGAKTPPSLTPVPLGLRERIDQVARARIDQPMRVTVFEIPSDDDPTKGFVVILIPPSPAAPHMVDGAYRGRSDSTNMRLSDTEVRRIRSQREAAERDISDLLAVEIDRDPIPAPLREQAHLFIVAQPQYAPPDMLQQRISDWMDWLTKTLFASPPLDQGWEPDFRDAATSVHPRANGWAGSTLHQSRTLRPTQTDARTIDVEVHEEGGLRVFAAASDWAPDHSSRWLIDPAVPGLIRRTLWLADVIAKETTYLGNWDIGVALTGLSGITAHHVVTRGGLAPAYPEDRYQAATIATPEDLTEGVADIVERLWGRLNRALTLGRYVPPSAPH